MLGGHKGGVVPGTGSHAAGQEGHRQHAVEVTRDCQTCDLLQQSITRLRNCEGSDSLCRTAPQVSTSLPFEPRSALELAGYQRPLLCKIFT